MQTSGEQNISELLYFPKMNEGASHHIVDSLTTSTTKRESNVHRGSTENEGTGRSDAISGLLRVEST